MRDSILRPYTRLAATWIARTFSQPPTQAAMVIAQELLTPRREGTETDLVVAMWLDGATLGGLDEAGLLARVVGAMWAVRDHPDGPKHARNQIQEDCTVARWALRQAARYRSQRLPAKVARPFGDLCRRGLGPFALALWNYKTAVEEQERQRVRASMQFPSPDTDKKAP